MKTVKQIDFDEIFHYAERKYGIHWNNANDIFFNSVLKYGSVTTVYGGDDCLGYTSMYDEDKNSLDYTVEEVQAMNDNDKGYLIVAAYLSENNIKGEIQVDCR